MEETFSWMIGGPQGSGVDSAAAMMGRALALTGLWVYGKREYHSNIMGLHSYFQYRVGDRPVRSPSEAVDLLVTFEEETLLRHADAVVDGGGIVFDPGKTAKPLADVRAFHGLEAEHLRERLAGAGRSVDPAGVLEDAKGRGVHLYPFPYQEVLLRFSKLCPDVPAGRLARATNTLAVAGSFALLSADLPALERSVRGVFAAKQDVGALNVEIARLAFADARERFPHGGPRRLPKGPPLDKLLLNGTQAVALGKLLGGCRFQTYYPITPASDESEFLEAHETFPLRDGAASGATGSIVVVQTEDEIAALTMAIGAGLAGSRAATSTSGPGFSLMTEALGFAGINEVPVVVTLYQRAGPGTGLPTRQEQGDLRFAIHAGHGEFPRIVLASGDAEECLDDAVRCLNYAARYQLPVVHLVDKALASATTVVPFPDVRRLHVDAGRLVQDRAPGAGYAPYLRFAFAPDGVSPRAPLGTRGSISWHTGDEHDERGHIDEDPENRRRMMEKRAEKLRAAAREIPAAEKWTLHGPADAETVVVSWGSTKGAILDAVEALAARGAKIAFLQVRLVHPFPTDELGPILARARRRIAVEMNFSGQLAGLVTESTRIGFDTVLVKYNGRPLSWEEVRRGLERALAPGAPARGVLDYGR